MKIISIDVGMKHLAYCILDYDKSKNEYAVLEWNVMDLCKSKITQKCNGIMKNKQPCKRTPSFYKNDCYFCKSHAKKEKFIIPTKDFNKTKILKMKIKELKKICLEKKFNIPKKAKKQDFIDFLEKDLTDNYFDLIKKIDSRTIDIVTYGIRIKEEFNKLLEKYTIDCVLIENQIGPLALRMKMLQGMIIQHFIENNCTNIKEISPANKLKDFTNKKTTYKERKQLSIQVTKDLIVNTHCLNKWDEHFNTHKKKDDLADSFLQALWYIKNN